METTTKTLKKVLIIDDNEVDTLICSRVFGKYDPQVQITSFHGAKEALNYLKDLLKQSPENLPDLIILDLYMPLMNGWFFLKEYRQVVSHLKKDIVLLMASCTHYERDLSRIRNYKEINAHISKPITLQKIQEIAEIHFN